jgi:hydrogenase maturation protease
LSSPEENQGTLVLGVGNELMRDDGVGTFVARQLQAESLGPEVAVVAGATSGLDLIWEMEGYARVVLVDAARMGLAPGEVRQVPREEIEDRMVPLRSLHELALHDVLDLAELSGIAPEVVVVAVEPAEVLPGEGLTPAVAAAVPEMLRLVRTLVTQT